MGLPLRLRTLTCLMLVSVGLLACTSLPKPSSRVQGEPFSRVGRFAMTVNDSKGKQSAVQGVFSWRDDGQHYVLDLRNPLGSTQARLEGGPGVASLTYANGRQMFAADPDALIEDALGSRMPVVGLRDWLRGRVYAPPTLLGMVQDDQQRPLAFEQGGWRAHLSRYDALGPRLLVLERNDAGRHMVLRLVLNPP